MSCDCILPTTNFQKNRLIIIGQVICRMFTHKTKIIVNILIISSLLLSGIAALTYGQMTTKPCDSCGMNVDSIGQTRFKIVDASGHQYVACCPVCALKLIKTYGELTITSFCDYNGPNFPITINAKQSGSILTINPQSAIIILGGGCTKNRLVYNAAAADALLAPPNNGASQWLSPLTNATVLPNASRIGLAQAVLQYGGGATSICEQCGMDVDVTGQARFKIFDATGTLHIACCPVCALRLQRTYGDLNITSFCDYYGPNYPISIITKNNGTDVTVSPPNALIITAGGCTKNRIVYNSSAADALFAPPNNGTSKWLSTLSNDTANSNPTILGVAQAALINGIGLPNPTSTPSPTTTPTSNPSTIVYPSTSPSPSTKATPTQSPEPTATNGAILECEACGMDVTPESQTRYSVTDGTGKVHYVECFMCAMQLINDYETLHIATYCDWYGPDYPITVDTSNHGATVIVNPSTAIFLRGGSCVTARAAYNQTAADNLLAKGFSQNTSPEQQFALPSTTQVKLINEAVSTWYAQADTTAAPKSLTFILALVLGAVVIAVSIFAYTKLKRT
jgi:hypothetical protein